MKKFCFIKPSILVLLLSLFFLLSPLSLEPQKRNIRPLKPGEEGRGPWWMRATALTSEGRLPSLKSRKWWKKTLELKPGEMLMLEEGGEAKDRMAVRLESYELEDGRKVEILVWAIDDDGNESLKSGGDYHDDCYLYDLNRDGQIDLMIDYADENGDGQADFQEIRFFERGYLVRAWFGYDFENIGEIIKFQNPLELMAEIFTQNLNGKKIHFQNVYNQALRSWQPSGTCPMASFDLNDDGLTDLLVRCNLISQPGGPVISSLEISYDLDRGNGQESPFHYDLGLILAGKHPYNLDKYRLFSPKRRPPQEVFVVPYDEIGGLIKNLEVSQAGFSWREYRDDSLEKNILWKEQEGQGIGWPGERRELASASRCLQKWNVRREIAYLEGQPEFYYNEVDHKIHLFRAEEGWLPVGYLAGMPRVGEIRYFDTNGNGFFDRREIYLTSSTRPVLTLPLPEDRNRKLPFDLNLMSEFYLKEVLPAAVDSNETFLRAMKKLYSYDPPPGLASALDRATAGEKSYLLEFFTLLYFINLRDHLLTVINQTLFQELSSDRDGLPVGDLHPRVFRDPRRVSEPLSSDRAWKLARLLTELEQAYGLGQTERFEQIINRIKELGF
ncbi:MAG: hypothetical protein N3G18_08150 [Candidatus Saccharicenans sp.]|nr:hypothetical protein [Candidatus Saccharicenans sp.]